MKTKDDVVKHCVERGYKSVFLMHHRSELAEDLAVEMKKALEEKGIDVKLAVDYFGRGTDEGLRAGIDAIMSCDTGISVDPPIMEIGEFVKEFSEEYSKKDAQIAISQGLKKGYIVMEEHEGKKYIVPMVKNPIDMQEILLRIVKENEGIEKGELIDKAMNEAKELEVERVISRANVDK